MWPNETVDKLGLRYSANIEGVSLATFAARVRVFLVDCVFESTAEDDKGGQYNFLVRRGETTFFLSLARITDAPLVIRLRVLSPLERRKPDALIARLNPWLEHYYATRLEKGGDPAPPTGQTQPGAGALPMPEGKTQTGKSKGGRPRMKCHQDALQRLQDGQTKEANRYQWRQEYEAETGNRLEDMASTESDLYRNNVRRKFDGKN